jgi:hypothetical protein
MRPVRVHRLAAGAAAAVVLAVAAAPAAAAPAQVRAYGAVEGTTTFRIVIDGKVRAKRLAFEKATKRFALKQGVHRVVVRNAKGRRVVDVRVAARNDEPLTIAIAGTATKPVVVPIREAIAANATRAWARLANLVPGRVFDLVLAGQPFTIARNVAYRRTSTTRQLPKNAGFYSSGGLQLSLKASGAVVDTEPFAFVAGEAVTLVALPNGQGAKLRALPA